MMNACVKIPARFHHGTAINGTFKTKLLHSQTYECWIRVKLSPTLYKYVMKLVSVAVLSIRRKANAQNAFEVRNASPLRDLLTSANTEGGITPNALSRKVNLS